MNKEYSLIVPNYAMASIENTELDSVYTYNGKRVPRVSWILKDCIGNDGLVNWAGRVGYNKMTYYRDRALKIGNMAHSAIERYLDTGDNTFDIDISKYDASIEEAESARVAFNNFLAWENNLKINGNHIDEVIGIEVTVTNPWYGGTIDCIMRINGAVYVIDFKTSKAINDSYIYQTCAYAWSINSGYCDKIDHVDGIGIIRVDKSRSNCFDEYFLTGNIPYQYEMLDRYTSTWWSLVNSYYHLGYSRKVFNDKQTYPINDVIREESEKLINERDITS